MTERADLMKALLLFSSDFLRNRVQSLLDAHAISSQYIDSQILISEFIQVHDTDLIIADEPTGNLDPQLSLEITQLLYNISQSGTAVIMASHDYIAMQHFNGKVWVCKEGAIQLAESK